MFSVSKWLMPEANGLDFFLLPFCMSLYHLLVFEVDFNVVWWRKRQSQSNRFEKHKQSMNKWTCNKNAISKSIVEKTPIIWKPKKQQQQRRTRQGIRPSASNKITRHQATDDEKKQFIQGHFEKFDFEYKNAHVAKRQRKSENVNRNYVLAWNRKVNEEISILFIANSCVCGYISNTNYVSNKYFAVNERWCKANRNER